MIEVRDLTHRYGRLVAVQDLSFRVGRGELLGLLGPNGAGKSTAMRAVVGLLRPSAGRILIGGHNIGTDGGIARPLLGYLPENVALYRELRVREFLGFAARVKGIPGSRRRAELDRVVELCGLESVVNRLIGFCSRGFRQRIGLAQALLGDPPALVLDEPSVGLDPAQVADVRTRIAQLAVDKAVILSTHILPEASRLCSRVLILDRGRCVAEDHPAALAAAMSNRPRLRIRCEPLPEAQNTLRESPAVLSISVESGAHGLPEALVVELSEAEATPRVVKQLVDSGCAVHEVRPEQLGLEEVFLNLVRHEPAPASKTGEPQG
jgi:ABC-2 type transport system ATP-binding protein